MFCHHFLGFVFFTPAIVALTWVFFNFFLSLLALFLNLLNSKVLCAWKWYCPMLMVSWNSSVTLIEYCYLTVIRNNHMIMCCVVQYSVNWVLSNAIWNQMSSVVQLGSQWVEYKPMYNTNLLFFDTIVLIIWYVWHPKLKFFCGFDQILIFSIYYIKQHTFYL